MIVTATPDLVLDVLDAADPVTQRAAAAKLDALKSSDTDFAVDPTEASVRVNTLQTQIQTALSLTSQLQKISLVNYL